MSRESRLDVALSTVVAALPGGGEPRIGQQQMAAAVAAALGRSRHLFVRAGTGTGKSLAYLLPAILSERRVLVATATKALQEQLAEKDLPQIAAALDVPVDFAVLKGRSNYLCRQRLHESEVAGRQGELDVEEAGARRGELARQATTIAEWAARTELGDRAELSIEPDPRVWASFSVTAEECPGAFRCPSGDQCFAEGARARAAEAAVVIVNLHLLGAHLASGEVLLPDYDALVIDEAHALEEVMSHSLGLSFTSGRLRSIAQAGRALGGGESDAVTTAARALIELAERFDDLLAPYSGKRLRRRLPDDLAQFLALCATRVGELERQLGTLGEVPDGDRGPRAQRAQLAAARLRVELDRLGALSDDEVAWVSEGSRLQLEVAPIDVGSLLEATLFGERPTVCTSATLLPGLSATLGAPASRTDELDVGSPFNFEEQALLYCATHLPDRRSPEAEAALWSELELLIDAAGGRTLALFTSRGAMERAIVALRPRVEFPLLVQGEGGKAALIERFREQASSCLFATMGYWQGVDVPGASCSLVTIDRLPFSRPDDPLLGARRERAGERAFELIDLPRAATLLAQGAGRLVRSAEDRGVVAVLDRRLATASYRWQLVRAMPPMHRTKDREQVLAFLRSLRDEQRTSSAEPATDRAVPAAHPG